MSGLEYHSEIDYTLNDLLKIMNDNNASDLILKPGSPPSFRINKEIIKGEMDFLKPGDTIKLCLDIITEEEVIQVLQGKEKDMSYSAAGVGRFRVNIFRQRGSIGIVFRAIKMYIPKFNELGIPDVIKNFCFINKGLILVTGPTSSGKSTTLASMIDYINESKSSHIITIEDPIEYVYNDKNSVITQREIGIDTENFSSALKYVLRQNPDIILIGEMRDSETVHAALSAVETGHTVFSTLHTISASHTIERILEFFPKDEQDQVRLQLADLLYAVVSQRLLPSKDNSSMVLCYEIMINNPIIKKLIIDNRIGKLRSAIHQSTHEGMITMDQCIVALTQADMISYEEGKNRVSKPQAFDLYLKGHYPDIETGILGS